MSIAPVSGGRPATSFVLYSLLALCLLTGCEEPDSLERVRAMHARGQIAESLEPLRRLIAENPDDPELNYLYGASLRRTGSPDMAIWSLRKAAESELWADRAGIELGAAALAAEDWANAIAITSEILERSPDEPQAILIRAHARLSEKSDYEGALADYDRYLEFEPNDLEVWASRAATLIALGEVDQAAEAIADLERAAEESDAPIAIRGRVCVTRALFASERRLYDEAEAQFASCLENFPRDGTILDEYVDYLDGRGQPARANELLRARLDEEPELTALRISLSRRLLAMRLPEESEALLRAGLELNDSLIVSDLWAALADHFIAVDDIRAASDAYEKSLELIEEPSVFQKLALADVLARSGQNARALEAAQRLDNDTYRGLIEARVYLNQNEPARALARLDEVLPLWPNNPGARYWAARAAEQLGDFKRAIEEYRQAIRSSPEFSDAGLRLALLHEAEGAGEDAWAALGHFAKEHPESPEAAAALTRLASRYGPDERLRGLAEVFRKGELWPTVVSARADFLASTSGREQAVESIRTTRGLDLADPAHTEALRSLVRHLAGLQRFDEAQTALDAALSRSAESSALYEIQGLLLEQRGELAAARSAYERAVELDSKNAKALVGLGRRLAEAGELDAALELFSRGATADVDLAEAYVEAATRLSRAGRTQAAEERWQALLREQPWDSRAAMALVRLRLERGDAGPETLELAQRAVRFRGGDEAYRLLGAVYSERGEEALATEAFSRVTAAKTPG